MKRRRFLGMLFSGFAFAGVFGGSALRAARVRVLEALRARRYPGPVDDLDRGAVAKPGKWAG